MNNNTLVIADPHLPFTHRNYLEFCRDTARRFKCTRIACVGDLVDSHGINYHEHDPDGMSAGNELRAVKKELKAWFKCFPKMDLCVGNHDELCRRKALSHGLPEAYFKSFGDTYDAPAGWRWAFTWRYANWQMTHGTGTSGHDAAYKSMLSNRVSTVNGHIHCSMSVKYHASDKDLLFAMQVGCGIDRKSYAFNYGRDFAAKPILGVGLVLENGKLPMVVPMPL